MTETTKRKLSQKFFPLMLILPSIVVICVVIIYPLLRGIYMSFTDYNIMKMNNVKFIGLSNFAKLLTDAGFWEVIGFTFFYAIGTAVLAYIFGLIIALFLNQELKGRSVIRAMFLVPWIIPWVVAANSWLWILSGETGFINQLFMSLGVIKRPLDFFGRAFSARISVLVLNSWKSFPFMMLVLLAGIQNIPKELYESAQIDGANKWHSFIYITMPGLKSVTVFSTLLLVIWTFNGFESIYLLTQGGPVRATYTLSILTYRTAFYNSTLGYASAVAVTMMFFMIILSIIYMKITKSD